MVDVFMSRHVIVLIHAFCRAVLCRPCQNPGGRHACTALVLAGPVIMHTLHTQLAAHR